MKKERRPQALKLVRHETDLYLIIFEYIYDKQIKLSSCFGMHCGVAREEGQREEEERESIHQWVVDEWMCACEEESDGVV